MTGLTRIGAVDVRIETRKVAGKTIFTYLLIADYVDENGGKQCRHMMVYSPAEVEAALKTF
jgi:hypothetical protein